MIEKSCGVIRERVFSDEGRRRFCAGVGQRKGGVVSGFLVVRQIEALCDDNGEFISGPAGATM